MDSFGETDYPFSEGRGHRFNPVECAIQVPNHEH